MTRSQFILGSTLLCVSGTLAFFISFREQESKKETFTPTDSTRKTELRVDHNAPLPLSKRKIEKMDATIYEVSVSDFSLRDLGQRVEADSRLRLEEMTQRYQLTSNQRREVFPLLVSHHAEFQEGLIVNGSAAAKPSGKNLASEIYPLLDLIQQEVYQEVLLSNNEWWGDIIGQLREELDGALDAGEVDLVIEPSPNPSDE